MKEIIQEGKTREEALATALEKLGATEEQVEVELITASRDGLFGFLGSRGVKLKVTLKEEGNIAVAKPTAVSDDEGNVVSKANLRAPGEGNPEDQVEQFISKVLELLEVECNISVHEGENDIFVEIAGDDSGVIIGKFGQTLDSLQYLTNVIMGKDFGNQKKIVIDVSGYRERREASVRKLARSVARKVVKQRKSETLSPMSPQDRRTVHLALSNFKDVETISEGSGVNRKVIINFKK